MKYLAVTGARSEKEVESYLYIMNRAMKVGTTFQGRVWAVIECKDEDAAKYQAGRYHSGMMGASIHDSAFDAAISVIDRL